MKSVVLTTTGALLGPGICFFCLRLSAMTGFLPEFPNPGGEDDVELRFRYFLMCCLLYSAMSAWIGWTWNQNWRRGVAMLAALPASALFSFAPSRLWLESGLRSAQAETLNTALAGLYLWWMLCTAFALYCLSRKTFAVSGAGDR